MRSATAKTVLACLLLATSLAGAHGAPPKGWRQPAFGSRMTVIGVDRKVARSGKASVAIRATQAEPSAFGVCRQWVRAEPYRGKRLRVAAYLKTVGVGPTRRSGARLGLFVVSDTHRFGGPALRGDLIQGTRGWTKQEHVIDVPREAVLLAVDVVLVGPGQVWADDVKLEVVGADVPTTARCDRRMEIDDRVRERVRTRLRDTPRRPINLDFEAR